MPKVTYYHVSNPINRHSILSEGIKASKGWSYTYNHGEDVKPASFFSTSFDERFDSTYDDDIYSVDLSGVQLEPDKTNINHVLTYQEVIPVNRITLVYKGTGKDTF